MSNHPTSYSARLAHEISAALSHAEKRNGDGLLPYPFILGYLLGQCSDQDQDEINERLNRLREL